MNIRRKLSRTATVAGLGGTHAAWVWEFRGVSAWGPAQPGSTAREAEQEAFRRLMATHAPRVRKVRSRWRGHAGVVVLEDRAAHTRLAMSVSESLTYRAWRKAGLRFACDASFDPVSGRGAWGWTRAGSRELVTGLLDAPSSTFLELKAAHEALVATPQGATVELLIDYKPLVDAISAASSGDRVPSWPVLRRCERTRELFESLIELVDDRRVCATWVPGHRGHTLFRRVDQATRAAVRAERRAALV